MAIFHLNESNISRSDGRSAVACAAYRACEKLEDNTYGKTQDYTRKNGLEYKNIYAPKHAKPELLDRQILWNTVEKKEFNTNGSMKENARLSKEYKCALPYEITDEQRIKIVDDFCRDFVKKHNVIVDACIHAPHQNDDGTDNKNHHVHIMFTTRLINENGDLGKKQRTFNDNGPEILKTSRATFAKIVNQALEAAGLEERIDHRSNKERGIERKATMHEGVAVTQQRRRFEAEQKKPVHERNHKIKMPILAQENDAIKLQNLELEIIATEQLILTLKTQNISLDDIVTKHKTQKQKIFDDFFENHHQINSQKNLFANLDDAISAFELKQKKNSAFDDFDLVIAKSEVERQASIKAEAERQASIKAEAERQTSIKAEVERQASIKAEVEARLKEEIANQFKLF